jgi:hypothetical protein
MAHSAALTIDGYLNSLPPDRREVIRKVHQVIVKHLPRGYQEVMQYGMIGYVVPIKRYPNGYLNDKKTPLPYAALASQKNYISVYLMNIYSDLGLKSWFKAELKKSGKKYSMGKSCIRFKKIEDIPLDLIGKTVAKTSVDKYIQIYEASRKGKTSGSNIE